MLLASNQDTQLSHQNALYLLSTPLFQSIQPRSPPLLLTIYHFASFVAKNAFRILTFFSNPTNHSSNSFDTLG